MRGVRTPERRESVCVMQDIDVLARSERTCLMPDKNVLAEVTCLMPNMELLVIENEMLRHPRREGEPKTDYVTRLMGLWDARYESGEITDSEFAWNSAMSVLVGVSTECLMVTDDGVLVFFALDEEWDSIFEAHTDDALSIAREMVSETGWAYDSPTAYDSVLTMAKQVLA